MIGKLFVGCFLTSWILLWIASTLAFDVGFVWGIVSQVRATNYPSVLGVITHSELESSSDGDGTTYTPRLAYTYVVADKSYNGTVFRHGLSNSNVKRATRIVADHPVGKQIPVFYNPSDPADSSLETGLSGDELFLAMFLLPFNVITFGSWCVAWYVVRRPPLERPFAGYSVWTDSQERLHVVVSNPGLTWASVMAFGITFVLVFVIGLGVNKPTIPLMLVVWTFIIGCVVTAYVLARPLGQTPRQLVLDHRTVTVEIYRASKTEPDRIIIGSAVQSVTVAKKEESDSEGGLIRSFTPVVSGKDANGYAIREELGRWSNETLAISLAAGLTDWLQQCGCKVDG